MVDTLRLPVSMESFILRNKYRLLRWYRPDKFTDANPFKIVWIDPKRIKNVSKKTDSHGYGRVADGDWDISHHKFNQRPVFVSIKMRICNGADWEETPIFKRYRKRIKSGENVKGICSISELKTRYIQIDNIYEDIKNNGYQTKERLIRREKEGENYAYSTSRGITDYNSTFRNYIDEIHVNISRNGEILFRGNGQHRLSIAKILDIQSVPVLIETRHAEWQKLRDSIRSDKITTYPSDHPDLSSIR